MNKKTREMSNKETVLDLKKLPDLISKMMCCGNCRWNTDATVHNQCDQNQWVVHGGNDRGRGLCDNWDLKDNPRR